MLTQTLCTSFKAELLLGVHDFRVGGDTFKLALYTSAADLGAATSAYTTAGEVTGVNYTAGGYTLTNAGVGAGSGVGFASFAALVVPNVTLVARGALIYNTTPSATGLSGALVNPAVCVLDFGEDKRFAAQTLTIQFPANAATSALVRVG